MRARPDYGSARRSRRALRRRVREQHDELVAAVAADEIARPQRLGDLLSDPDQRTIAGLVSESSLIALKRSTSTIGASGARAPGAAISA